MARKAEAAKVRLEGELLTTAQLVTELEGRLREAQAKGAAAALVADAAGAAMKDMQARADCASAC